MRPDGGRGIQLHPEFLAAVQDPETYEAAIACAKGQGWPTSTVVNSDLSAVIQAIGRSRPPAIILADIDGGDDPTGQIAQLAKMCGTRSRILAIGSANDVASYRSMIQSGAADYLVKPLNSVALRDAVLPLLTARDNDGKPEGKNKSGFMYVFIGVRGGVGTSTIAVNSAWMMAHELNQKTALVDLDLQYGTCDLSLDLEPGRGMREVLTNPDRIDSLLINSAMSKESDNLTLFCAEESLEEIIDFDTSGPLALTRELRKEYDHIVVDLPRSLVSRHRRLIVSADHIVLVTDMTLSGIRDTQRIIGALTSLGLNSPIHVVAGRVGDGEAQVGRSTFERSAHAKVEAAVPHDTATARLAASKGRSISAVSPGTALTRAIRNITTMLTGQTATNVAGKSGGLGATLGSFFKKG